MAHSDAYVAFMMECKAAYADICERVKNGDVPAGNKAVVKIEVPADVVDRIRYDVLVAPRPGGMYDDDG